MTISVLITQCLQRDFVDLLEPYQPLPNRLHVGHQEALRLLGADVQSGPVSQLMAWARGRAESEMEIIHIRDWHDPNDPRQRDHLARFGDHCVRGTRGAELVFGLDEAQRANEIVVDAIALNDFEGTTLNEHLTQIQRRAGGEPLRVGVVGVWTEAKVSFLLYDLKTRCGIEQLATCSALTASASRAQHFNALEQLGRILGVECFDSVGEFVSWLAPGAALALPPVPARFGGQVIVSDGQAELSQADRDLVTYLHRDSARIVLEPLSGGFSGAAVYRASSTDAFGHQHAPSVVKLGPQRAIARERVNFERVEEVLGNNAPNVRAFVDLGERAGIRYSYAAMGQGTVRTFKKLFESGYPSPKLDAILHAVFDEILGPLYAAARYEKLPILAHYAFSPDWASSVRKTVTALVGERANARELDFSGGYRASNVCLFYEEFLRSGVIETATDFHYASVVHGDLNGANILVDGRENVWVIDYFHTGRGHVLKDLAKLENDILYIYTPIPTREALAEALRVTSALRAVEDLRQPLPERIEGVASEPLLRAWAAIRTLREIVARLCREDRHPLQMDVALLRFAVHTLSFDESSPLQKEWALAAACGFADDIVRAHAADRELRVDWLDSARLPKGRFGLTLCPGRRDRGRDLTSDLQTLTRQKVTRLLCLVTDEELEWAGVSDIARAAAAHGIELRHHALMDQGAPSVEDAEALVAWCREACERGEAVVVHCMGGLGRSGVIAACLLASAGASGEEAITTVRSARGPRAIESRQQERFVRHFAETRARA
ncbi:MAG TPA: isochorismatase family protein [Polyangiaceae bacterium]|nr:isochorismatase family protein [Polyangiaceae bacterium]